MNKLDNFFRILGSLSFIVFIFLFMFGMVLPFIISTDKLPLFLLIPMGIMVLFIGTTATYWFIQTMIMKKKIEELSKEITDDQDYIC